MANIGRIAERWREDIHFLKGVLASPREVGAILPSSKIVARSMASVVTADSPLPVLELGPGTGSITRAILGAGVAPERLYCIEYSPTFAAALQIRFPGINVIEGDVFDLPARLDDLHLPQFDCVVSGLPLLNFPLANRIALIEQLMARLAPGRPLVQFSYGISPPVPDAGQSFFATHFDYVLRNVPPARIWLYRHRSDASEPIGGMRFRLAAMAQRLKGRFKAGLH